MAARNVKVHSQTSRLMLHPNGKTASVEVKNIWKNIAVVRRTRVSVPKEDLFLE